MPKIAQAFEAFDLGRQAEAAEATEAAEAAGADAEAEAPAAPSPAFNPEANQAAFVRLFCNLQSGAATVHKYPSKMLDSGPRFPGKAWLPDTPCAKASSM